MKGLVLPCKFHTEETAKIAELELGIEQEYEEAEITFYRIDAISPETHDDYSQTIIHIGETNFLCSLPYIEVRDKIENWNR